MSSQEAEMRLPRHFRKSFSKLTIGSIKDLRYEFQMLEADIRQGTAEADAVNKLVMRMYLPFMGFTFWGGTKVVSIDKDKSYETTDRNWINRMMSIYDNVCETTNRRLFGRRYLMKVPYPTSFVFYEKGSATEGKHIHTLHHFPEKTIHKAEEYLSTLSCLWNSHRVNRNVGRYFWFEKVENQEDASRYATKRMSGNYENGWFVVS